MSEPTTETGLQLQARLWRRGVDYDRSILATEAEARAAGAAAELRLLREAWEEGKHKYASTMHDVGHMAAFVDGLLADPEPTDDR